MDLAEIDNLFSRYRDAERRIGANLLELDTNPTLKMLAAGSPKGDTARTLGPAIASVPVLWSDFELLRSSLSSIEAVRGTSRRVTDAVVAELEQLLTARTITGASGGMTSIAELVAAIDVTYDAVGTAVVTIEHIWSKAVPRLDAARAALGPLREQAAAIEVTAEPALDTLAQLITDVDRQLGDDPVALSDASLGALDAALELARTRMAELRVAYDSYAADIERARALHVALTEDLNAVRESYATVTKKIVRPEGVADLTDPHIAAYRALRAEAPAVLEGAVERGVHWRTRRRQLDAWMTRATTLDRALREAAGANLEPIRTRDELRGLLTAFEAKAASRRRIERPAIIDQLRAARDEAGRAPCDVARLSAMLDTLARDLSLKDM